MPSRSVETIDSQTFTVRRALPSDCDRYYVWACDREVRRNSLQNTPLALGNHRVWFREKLADPLSYLYLVESRGNPVGQVRFLATLPVAAISYSLDSAFRGKGLSRYVVNLALDRFSKDCPTCYVIVAQVKTSNEASLKALRSCGFIGKVEDTSDDVLVLELRLV